MSLIGFTYKNNFDSSIGMTPFEALYGKRYKTALCWYAYDESVVLGPEMVQQMTKMIKIIQEKMKASQSRHESYHDKQRKALEFQEGYNVFLRVIPMTEVERALKSRNLMPSFISPYHILKRVGEMAYIVALPLSLLNLRSVFHVSQLRKYV